MTFHAGPNSARRLVIDLSEATTISGSSLTALRRAVGAASAAGHEIEVMASTDHLRFLLSLTLPADVVDRRAAFAA